MVPEHILAIMVNCYPAEDKVPYFLKRINGEMTQLPDLAHEREFYENALEYMHGNMADLVLRTAADNKLCKVIEHFANEFPLSFIVELYNEGQYEPLKRRIGFNHNEYLPVLPEIKASSHHLMQWVRGNMFPYREDKASEITNVAILATRLACGALRLNMHNGWNMWHARAVLDILCHHRAAARIIGFDEEEHAFKLHNLMQQKPDDAQQYVQQLLQTEIPTIELLELDSTLLDEDDKTTFTELYARIKGHPICIMGTEDVDDIEKVQDTVFAAVAKAGQRRPAKRLKKA
jgi:hypothetical protein